MTPRVYFDSQLMAAQDAHVKLELKKLESGESWRIDGPASPRWVNCPRCGAYRGDGCHTGRSAWCSEREAANRVRMLKLKTWALPWLSPCCDRTVFLVYRTSEDELQWSGVPCFDCGKMYDVNLYGSDAEVVQHRQPVDRIHPEMVEVTCWAAEEEDPWKKT